MTNQLTPDELKFVEFMRKVAMPDADVELSTSYIDRLLAIIDRLTTPPAAAQAARLAAPPAVEALTAAEFAALRLGNEPGGASVSELATAIGDLKQTDRIVALGYLERVKQMPKVWYTTLEGVDALINIPVAVNEPQPPATDPASAAAPDPAAPAARALDSSSEPLTVAPDADGWKDVEPSKCSSKTGYDSPECPKCHDCRSVTLIEDNEPFKVVGEVVPRTHWVVYVCHICKVVTVADFTLRYAGDGDYMKARELPHEFSVPFDEFSNTHVMQRDALIRRYLALISSAAPIFTPPAAPAGKPGKLTAAQRRVLHQLDTNYKMLIGVANNNFKVHPKTAKALVDNGYAAYADMVHGKGVKITPAGRRALSEAK